MEKLRFRFVENVYFAEPGQSWFEWGVSWGRHKSYSKLSDFQAGLGIDLDSQVFDPGLASLSALDCRVSAKTMAEVKKSYPQGPVPGVILGLSGDCFCLPGPVHVMRGCSRITSRTSAALPV